MSKGTVFTIGALAGALIGVCIGVMIAPRSGLDTSFSVARKAGSIVGDFECFASGIPGNARNIAQGPLSKKMNNQETDELREKISAVREKIAESKNADV